MKVIIPVAGAGTKLRPFTYTQPKALIPLAGKTILSFILDELIEAGLNEYIFIIGYLGEKIQDYVNQHYPHIKAQFVVQNERSGTGHAIALTEALVENNEEILIVYGDTICEYDMQAVLKSEHCCLGVKKVDDPRNFGVAEIDSNGNIKHVVEKPAIPKSNMAIVGVYKICDSATLFSIIKSGIKNKENQEYSLTEAIDEMILKGTQFKPFQVGNWFDCGKKESLIETNASLLNKLEFVSEEIPFFDNTIIIHPVSIANGCNISNSIIGPNVTIGENATINNSIINDSIIGSYSQLHKVVLHSSLVGSDAFIKGNSQSLNIGDNTEIDLS